MLLVQLNTQPEHPDYAQIRQPPPFARPSIISRFFVIDSLSPHSPDVGIDPLPRGLCAKQQTPRAGDTGEAVQRRPACDGAMRIIACIEDPEVIGKILADLNAKASEPEAPRRPPCRAPPQRGLFEETG